MSFRIAVLATIVAISSVPAFADPPRENLQIFNDIQERVNGYGYFTIFDSVAVGVDSGFVTLTGSVTNPYKKSAIEKRVAKVEGVDVVDNQIEVLPVSQLDDRLRYLAARAIYGHPAFGPYLRARPSIQIVVNRGHITLTGVVNNEVDEALALLVAGQVGAFSVSSDLRTTDEVDAELELL